MKTKSSGARRILFAASSLLFLHVLALAYGAWVHSPTLNEPGHLVAGISNAAVLVVLAIFVLVRYRKSRAFHLVFAKPTASGRGPKEVRTDPWGPEIE
jgi:hypothetical protein